MEGERRRGAVGVLGRCGWVPGWLAPVAGGGTRGGGWARLWWGVRSRRVRLPLLWGRWRVCVGVGEEQDPAGADQRGVGECVSVGLGPSAVELVEVSPSVGVAELLFGDAPQRIVWCHPIGIRSLPVADGGRAIGVGNLWCGLMSSVRQDGGCGDEVVGRERLCPGGESDERDGGRADDRGG